MKHSRNLVKVCKTIFLLPATTIKSHIREGKKRNAERHKKYLFNCKAKYTGAPDITFAFQFHNKSQNISQVLRPFLDEINAKNIIAFSDGCCDSTTTELERQLNGFNHITISRNDTHEISNYRMAIEISKILGAKYIALLQDDDLYLQPVHDWIETSRKQMAHDPSLAIIGLNGGANFNIGCYMRQADQGMCSERFESLTLANPSIDGAVVNLLGKYVRSEAPALPKTYDGSKFRYTASVNRAPQIMRVSHAIDLGFFPKEMEPYQYDDYFNCFTAWRAGFKVMLAPISGKTGLGEGGMRLYNNINRNNRPMHFVENHNFIYDRFGDFVNSGKLQELVDSANVSLEAKVKP